jgi:hypothetical protein
MEKKHHQNLLALFLSLSNLNIFGLGYFLSGQKKRWLISLIGNLSLLTVGYLTNASKKPGAMGWDLSGCFYRDGS